MTQKDLNEIKNMTGLVSESELKNTESNNVASVVTESADNDELQKYVGTFIKCGNIYGMIDGVYHGRLGMVHGSADYWDTGIIRQSWDICKDEADKTKARMSAMAYYTNESESLERRLAMNFKNDDVAELWRQLANCKNWLIRLQAA